MFISEKTGDDDDYTKFHGHFLAASTCEPAAFSTVLPPVEQ